MVKRRGVSLFSFSFVDILATTTGVLLFILLMAVLNQSGFAAYQAWSETLTRLESEQARAAEDAEKAKKECEAARNATAKARAKVRPIAAANIEDVEKIEKKNAALEKEARVWRGRVEGLEKQRDALQGKIAGYREAMPKPGKVYVIPKTREEADDEPVHVDCRKDRLIILGTDLTADPSERRAVPLREIPRSGGAFGRLIGRLRRAPAPVPFDTIRLTNGRVVRGRIMGETAGTVYVAPRSGRGPRRGYSKKTIAEIIPRVKRKVIVFWVRPDGIETFTKARTAAKRQGVAVGWEPAEENWAF